MLKQINPHAAGIDVGSEQIFVGIAGEPVRSFETFTASFENACEYLKHHHVTNVAMEATGVYWIALYEVLEKAGLEVCVVNGAHVKNVPGRKSDVADCQWLAELHSHGLLRASFVAPEEIRTLRSYQRLRDDHIAMSSSHVLHMQKALDLMNLKIHNVLSQTTGVSGLALIGAILKGEREPSKLVELCAAQILKTKREKMLLALQGNYRPEHLFALRQALECWEHYQKQIAQCDREIEALLAKMTAGKEAPPLLAGRKLKKLKQHPPQIHDLHHTLMKLTGGKDPTQLPAMTDYGLLMLVSEVGTDMSKWKTGKDFTSWLGLAPGKRQSGKRNRRSHHRPKSRAGQIFPLLARNVGKSKYLALGGFYRRIKSRNTAAVANVATARKLALLFYNTMRYGMDYVEEGLKRYEAKYRERTLHNLQRAARNLGMTLIPLSPANA
jgi:transposase